MNEDKIKYLGEYRFRSGARHSETHWASRISFLEQGRRVVDSAGRIDGQDVIRLIPYGETNHVLDGILHDGDLLAYIEGAFDIKLPEFATLICRKGSPSQWRRVFDACHPHNNLVTTF